MAAVPASATRLGEALGSPAREPSWPFVPANLTVQLALASPPPGTDPADLVDPFVVLSDRGAFSRVLLAEVVGPTGTSVLPLAVKLQSDEYPLLGSGGAALTNPEVEEAWRREISVLELAGPAGVGIPAIAEVIPRESGEAGRLPPTLYCKRRRAFFTACCPECGEPLRDLRDNHLLEERGLPRFDTSLARFLACTSCLSGGSRRLWTLVRDGRVGDDIGDIEDLLVALGPLARSPGDDRRLPCQGCEHVPTCYPDSGTGRPEVLRNVTPLTFYESRCLATEMLHLRYDELAALLGGAPLEEILTRMSESGRREALRDLEGRLGGEGGFFFQADPSGKLGLETLRLKLGLFRQLCLGTAALHRHTRAPHLGLDPSRAMVRILDARTGLPDLWSFKVAILGIGNAAPRVLPAGDPADLPARSYPRPRLVDPVFAAPSLREAPIEERPGTLTLRNVSRAADGRVVLEAELGSDGIDFSTIGDHDTIDVSIVQGRPPLALTLVATPSGRSGTTLRLRSIPLDLAAEVRDQLPQLVGQSFPRARFTVHPCLHVPCDVHALGMMLLVSLLGNAERGPALVRRAVDELVREVGDGGDDALDRARGRLAAAVSRGTLGPRHLFAHPDERGAAAGAVPAGLWLDALLLGLRAVTTIRGFSVCRSSSDFDPAHPEVKVEHLLQLLDVLIRQIDAVLFGLPGRAREVHAAIARIAGELNLADG